MADGQIRQLAAISPLDGRYQDKVKELEKYFSEGALIKQRVWVEAKYVLALVDFLETVKVSGQEKQRLLTWAKNLTDKDCLRVKKIEAEINHDVKAVEYFIRENLGKLGLKKLSVWIHWGLTSEDVNNLAYGVILSRFKKEQLVVLEKKVIEKLLKMAGKYTSVVMPARTHGQIAVPTTVGKELAVFVGRASWWLKKIKEQKLGGKLNGAVGNFNAQVKLYPKKDWLNFSQKFISGLGLQPVAVTTQIEPGDRTALFLDLIRGLNNVWLDLSKDCWLYICLDYFKQKGTGKEVGSSTMPHKVNPIDFENAEGNLELANSILMMMSNKLMISRLQRDLSDSTVKRNFGVVFGHTALAIKSLMKGLGKIEPNTEFLKQEIKNHPEMLGELEQLKMKVAGDEQAYEKIKKMTRGKGVGPTFPASWRIRGAMEYIGLAEKITKLVIKK
ncbi:MAG: adenylosuccinate lyase [Candidatus Beckwithbacteria bacterium]|nr:adenylosuccinate lyase [Candidatus Beckwithbacteria bacterium]